MMSYRRERYLYKCFLCTSSDTHIQYPIKCNIYTQTHTFTLQRDHQKNQILDFHLTSTVYAIVCSKKKNQSFYNKKGSLLVYGENFAITECKFNPKWKTNDSVILLILLDSLKITLITQWSFLGLALPDLQPVKTANIKYFFDFYY